MRGLRTLTSTSLLAILAFTSCGPQDNRSGPFGGPGRSGEVVTEYNRNSARVLLLDECPVVKREDRPVVFAPLLLAIAPVVANVAVGAISTYLEKAESDLSANYVAFGADALFDEEGALKKDCLVVARATFGSDWTGDRGQAPGSLGGGAQKALEASGFAGYPELYLEAALQQATDTPFSVTITPHLLHFADSAAPSRGSGRKSIGVFLTLNTMTPEPTREAAKEAAVATVPFEFRNVAIGSEYRVRDSADPQKNPLYEQRRALSFNAAEDGVTGSVNLYAFVTETEDTPALYKLINDAITANRATLQDALKELISDAMTEAGGAQPAP